MKSFAKKIGIAMMAGLLLLGIGFMNKTEVVLAEDTYTVPVGFMNYKNSVDYGTLEGITYFSDVTNTMRNAKVLLPAGYDEDKEYPVLYMIHGIGGNQDAMYNDNAHLVVGNAVAEGVAKEMIIVFPNACANKTGTPPQNFYSLEHYKAYDDFLYDLTENLMYYIEDNYPVKTGREYTAICGFSMGGRVTLHVGFTCPDLFGYIGAFCPAPGIFEYTHMGVHETGLFTKKSFTLPKEYMDNTLVEVMAGTNDTLVIDFPESYHDALENNGVPHIWYMTQGGDTVNKGDGGHNDKTYKHGLYHFLEQMSLKIDELESEKPEPKPPVEKLPYVDVAEADWFYNSVAYTYYEKLMTGMDATHFGPYGQLSRAQFALILYRMEGEPGVTTEKSFNDIFGDEWYGQAVLWAAENGIVTGYQDGNFGPADNITREQMAVMMYRYAKYLKKDVSTTADIKAFEDVSSVSSYAAEAFAWANGMGIITGKENGTMLSPLANTARAEAAAIIQRFMTAYAE